MELSKLDYHCMISIFQRNKKIDLNEQEDLNLNHISNHQFSCLLRDNVMNLEGISSISEFNNFADVLSNDLKSSSMLR